MDGLTIEDNVFWHTGWRLGVSRDADPSVGGPTYFRHPIYQQTNSIASIVRRNLFMDGAGDGGSLRNDTIFTFNVSVDNPIGIGVGVQLAGGSLSRVSYNAFLGDADVNNQFPRGMGIWAINGKVGSEIDHNLVARTRNPAAVNVAGITIEANLGNTSTFAVHDNVIYLWADGPLDHREVGTVQVTYDNNFWGDVSSGTNRNTAGIVFPHPYTVAELFAALGCVDKDTCARRIIETPELGWADRARSLLFAGYGMAQ